MMTERESNEIYGKKSWDDGDMPEEKANKVQMSKSENQSPLPTCESSS